MAPVMRPVTSSGELVAMRPADGQLLWSESLAGQGLELSRLQHDRRAGAAGDHDVRSGAGAVEDVAQGDAAVVVDRIGLQRHRGGQGRGGEGAEQRGEDQGAHQLFTWAATDSISSAVLMTLEFIS